MGLESQVAAETKEQHLSLKLQESFEISVILLRWDILQTLKHFADLKRDLGQRDAQGFLQAHVGPGDGVG